MQRSQKEEESCPVQEARRGISKGGVQRNTEKTETEIEEQGAERHNVRN